MVSRFCQHWAYIVIYLFGVLRRFQHYTGHITTGSWKGRGNQYIEFVRVLYCKLPTNDKQLPAFPLKVVTGIEPRPQRWEARVLPLCHCGPCWAYIGPVLAIDRMVNRFCHLWANICQPLLKLYICIYLYILLMLGQHWASDGFLFKMAASNNIGFWEIYFKIIDYGMFKNHISMSPQFLTNFLTILDIKIIFSL